MKMIIIQDQHAGIQKTLVQCMSIWFGQLNLKLPMIVFSVLCANVCALVYMRIVGMFVGKAGVVTVYAYVKLMTLQYIK